MQIDFSATICTLENEPIEDEDKTPLTLRKVAIEALLATLPDERGEPERITGEIKVKHAVLATDIFAAQKPLEMKTEDIALLKQRIGRAYTPLVVMRAWSIIEGEIPTGYGS